MTQFKEQFLLDPSITYLNHGAFGATPKPVFATYQYWQQELEREPYRFLMLDLPSHLKATRVALGDYLSCNHDDIALIPNCTYGLNVVARSLNLQVGDEVLATDHEFGSLNLVWEFNGLKRGFHYIQQPIPFPVTSKEDIVEALWTGITAKTKVIFVSHITSPTALRIPIKEICQLARRHGILTIVDGSHGPGQIEINLQDLDPDIYIGNTYKWLCSPKGSAFLYCRTEIQDLLEPLIVSWGWKEEPRFSSGSRFTDYFQWYGTIDPASYLSIRAAIDFQKTNNWPEVRQRCHDLCVFALENINRITGLHSLYPNSEDFFAQMFVAALPDLDSTNELEQRLRSEFSVVVPVISWRGRLFLRVSVNAYNDHNDVNKLLTALEQIL